MRNVRSSPCRSSRLVAFRGALAGGLAIEAHLLSQGRATGQRGLNDVDVVVESFASLPGSLADGFLLHHIHPYAREGKTLLQLIDPERALRIDVFRQFGATLARAEALNGALGPFAMISLEDVVARTTSLVFGSLRRGQTIDPKYAEAFQRLARLGEPVKLDAAWRDHRQAEPEAFHQAAQRAQEYRSPQSVSGSRAVFDGNARLPPVRGSRFIPARSSGDHTGNPRLLVERQVSTLHPARHPALSTKHLALRYDVPPCPV